MVFFLTFSRQGDIYKDIIPLAASILNILKHKVFSALDILG
jgi:hypothetical protein